MNKVLWEIEKGATKQLTRLLWGIFKKLIYVYIKKVIVLALIITQQSLHLYWYLAIFCRTCSP